MQQEIEMEKTYNTLNISEIFLPCFKKIYIAVKKINTTKNSKINLGNSTIISLVLEALEYNNTCSLN